MAAKQGTKANKRVKKPRCDQCKTDACSEGKDCFGLKAELMTRYKEDPDIAGVSRAAAEVEAKFYGEATRLEEIVHFAKRAGFKHLGVAYCKGFQEEARRTCEMLRVHFKVSSVCCKNSGIAKKDLDFPNIHQGRKESICNPLGQAAILNRAGTDLNIILGLCVGHDALFNRESKALVTTFVAKDRVLAHNPVGALYCPYVNRRLEEGLFAG